MEPFGLLLVWAGEWEFSIPSHEQEGVGQGDRANIFSGYCSRDFCPNNQKMIAFVKSEKVMFV